MNRIKSLLLLVVGLGLIVGGVWGWIQIKKINDLNTQLNEQLMAAKLEIGKAHTQFGEAQKKIALLDKQLKDEIKAHGELIKQYGELLAQYNASGGGNSTAPTPIDTPTDGTVAFVPGKIYVAQTDKILQPFAPPVSFEFKDHRLSITSTLLTKPFQNYSYYLTSDIRYDLHLKIMAQVVQTITESGAVNNYANIFEVDDKGNKIGKFELSSFEVIVEYPTKARFHLFNPKLDIGSVIGFNGVPLIGASIGFSIGSYGITRNDLSWRFLRLGAIFHSEGTGFDLEPFTWNAAGSIPIIQNLWIGPNINYDLNARRFGLGISVGVIM